MVSNDCPRGMEPSGHSCRCKFVSVGMLVALAMRRALPCCLDAAYHAEHSWRCSTAHWYVFGYNGRASLQSVHQLRMSHQLNSIIDRHPGCFRPGQRHPIIASTVTVLGWHGAFVWLQRLHLTGHSMDALKLKVVCVTNMSTEHCSPSRSCCSSSCSSSSNTR